MTHKRKTGGVGKGKPRKKVEPLDEGMVRKRKWSRYTADDIKLIKKRYYELVQEGLNDADISRRIGKELGRSAGSVEQKIKGIRKNWKVGENPNNQKEYTEEEVELIKRRYNELVGKGLNDAQIARRIIEGIDRSAASISQKLREMRESEEIGENPNNQKEYTEEEIKLIKRRYDELVREGFNDAQIARRIGKEIGRSRYSIASKIKKMREKGEIEKNPNNIKDFSEEEIKLIKRRYTELVEEGLEDFRIFKRISKEIGRNKHSVINKIRKMREKGEVEENPNKDRERYTNDKIELIKRRYAELVEEGFNDAEIARMIAEEVERNVRSVERKMRELREKKEIGNNPNIGSKSYTEEEIKLIKRRYTELVEEGVKDAQIARRIGEELGRNFSSIDNKIRELKGKKEIGNNPNKQENKRYTKQEIELIKGRYNELVREGLKDFQIAKKIGSELGRNAGSVEIKIRKIRENDEIGENPNRQDMKKFTGEDVELIKRRYAELVEKGFTNAEIYRGIGNELGRTSKSIGNKIRLLKRAGEFADAEALREKQDILGVVKALEEFGEEE